MSVSTFYWVHIRCCWIWALFFTVFLFLKSNTHTQTHSEWKNKTQHLIEEKYSTKHSFSHRWRNEKKTIRNSLEIFEHTIYVTLLTTGNNFYRKFQIKHFFYGIVHLKPMLSILYFQRKSFEKLIFSFIEILFSDIQLILSTFAFGIWFG